MKFLSLLEKFKKYCKDQISPLLIFGLFLIKVTSQMKTNYIFHATRKKCLAILKEILAPGQMVSFIF